MMNAAMASLVAALLVARGAAFDHESISQMLLASEKNMTVIGASANQEEGQVEDESQVYQEMQRRLAGTAGPKLAADFGGKAGFYHGVASGDPLANSVIIWTRYTPLFADEVVSIQYRIAVNKATDAVKQEDLLNPAVNEVVKVGTVSTSAASDWTVKLDVTGLEPGTSYVYGFTVDGGTTASHVGMTNTAPVGPVSEMNYAIFSCAHWGFGYFHSYDVAATIKNLDFWIHVGDYIYEYGNFSTYGSESTRGVSFEPPWEIVTLQDYRLRYGQYNTDEGLQNLRRRAPMIAVWDDHELSNNAYVDGAENHQATCTANEASSAADQNKAGCASDEGKYTDRMKAATKAYMEWMPIRRGAGTTGLVDTSITQIIEWGDLATIVGLDTRLKARSKDPTIGLSFWASDVVALATANKDISTWMESPLVEQFKAAAKVLQDARANQSFAQLGSEQRKILEDAFKASKAAGKPWQIFAAATMMGPQTTPNFAALPDVVGAALKPSAQALVAGLHDAVAFARQCTAGALFEVPWNSDGFDGFSYERGLILESFKQHTNNPIVLGGDLHDSWAWTLFDGGVAQSGTPVAVNLGAPGVTSPGWGGSLAGMFQSAGSSMWDFIHKSFMAGNPGLKYANTKDKGFIAVKATKTRHVAEFYHINDEADAPASPSYATKSYKDARTAGRLTAPYYCGTSLVTTAGSKGSLAEQASCEVVFQTESWPAEWSTIKLPAYTIPPNEVSPPEEVSASSTTRSSSWRGLLAAGMLAGVAFEFLGFAA